MAYEITPAHTVSDKFSAQIKPAWYGPHSSAVAAILACNYAEEKMDAHHLNAAIVVAIAKGEFDLDDFCALMAEDTDFVAQKRDDGWYACYDAPVQEP